VGRRREAEPRIRKVHVDAAVSVVVYIIWSIEQIEEFETDLEHDTFGDVCVLVKVDIGFNEIRAAECIVSLVSFLAESRDSKVALRNSA
jgi:hypothetical protein